MRYVRGRNGVLLLILGMPFAKALQAEWRIESSPGSLASVVRVCWEKEFCSTRNHFLTFYVFPTLPHPLAGAP